MPPSSPQIVPFPIGHYADTQRHPPFDADTEAAAITTLLTDHLGGTVVPWDLAPSSRGLTAVEDRLARWAHPQDPRCSILVWIGHGESDHDRAALIVPGGVRTDHRFTAELLARHLHDENRRHRDQPRWTIVLIEACGAGRFVELLTAELVKLRAAENLLLIGVGEKEGSGYLAVARRVLSQVVDRYTDNDTEISLYDLAGRIERSLLGGGKVIPLEIAAHVVTRTRLTITAPVDVYGKLRDVLKLRDAMASLPAAERAHFARKGMGAEVGELAWHFTGRERELATIADWLATGPGGLLVVTGRAGTGKSAVLGNLLIRARPALRDLLTQAGFLTELRSAGRARPLSFDLTLHLTGATVADVIGAVLEHAGLPPLDVTPQIGTQLTDQQLRDRLIAALQQATLRRAGRRMTVLADALDEAQQPHAVAGLLRDLATLSGVQLVVGTRASTKEGPDQPDSEGADLLDALDPHRTARQVLIQRDVQALGTYVRQRLASVTDQTDRAAADAVAHVARRVGAESNDGAGRDFLFARLLVHEIVADTTLLQPERRPVLNDLLAANHRSLFATAHQRLRAGSPATGALVCALAFAHGRGLPRADELWAIAAGALHDDTVTDDDIDRTLDVAAPYIMVDAEHGQSVYRLAHQIFNEHFRTSPEHMALARRVLAALLDHAIVTPLDQPLNPYLVRHLPAHAASLNADGWKMLATYPNLLDRIDAGRVADDIMRAGFGRYEIPPEILAIVTAAHALLTSTPGDRRGLLDLALARQGRRQPLGDTNDRHSPDGPNADPSRWRVPVAALRQHPVHRSLTGHTSGVNRVAAFTGSDGRTLLATTSDDRTVRIWDPATATAVGAPLTGHTGTVTGAVAFTGADGRTLLATTSDDRTVRIWDPATATAVGELEGHIQSVRGVAAFAGLDGRTLLATTSDDRTVRIWDPATATAVGVPLTGHTDWVSGVAAFTGPDGRTLLATTSHDRTVRIWDPATATPVGAPLTGHTGPVTGVAAFTGPDGRTLLATTSWDITVRIWDPATSTPVGAPLIGHTGPVTGVAAFTGPDGRTPLATTSWDITVRIWNPAQVRKRTRFQTVFRRRTPHQILTGHTLAVTGVATFTGPDGRTLLATTSDDRTVRIWDPATATAVGAPLTGHTDWVTGVAAFSGPDGRNLLATTSRDETVRIWAPGSRRLLYTLGLAEPAASVCSVGEDLVVALSDGFARITVRGLRTGATTPEEA